MNVEVRWYINEVPDGKNNEILEKWLASND